MNISWSCGVSFEISAPPDSLFQTANNPQTLQYTRRCEKPEDAVLLCMQGKGGNCTLSKLSQAEYYSCNELANSTGRSEELMDGTTLLYIASKIHSSQWEQVSYCCSIVVPATMCGARSPTVLKSGNVCPLYSHYNILLVRTIIDCILSQPHFWTLSSAQTWYCSNSVHLCCIQT